MSCPPGKLHISRQLRQRLGDARHVTHEASVEVHHAKEGLYVTLVLGRRPHPDRLGLRTLHLKPFGRDDVPEKIDGCTTKRALGQLGVQLVLPQLREYLPKVHQVFSVISAVHDDVVQVGAHEVAYVGLKDLVHQGHEGCGGIGQPKGKNQELKESVLGPKGRQRDGFGVHSDLVVARPQVQRREYGSLA